MYWHMNLALNNLRRLIRHKTRLNKTKFFIIIKVLEGGCCMSTA